MKNEEVSRPTAESADGPLAQPEERRVQPAAGGPAGTFPAGTPSVAAGPTPWRVSAAGSDIDRARPSHEAVAPRAGTRRELTSRITRRTAIRRSFWAGVGVMPAGAVASFLGCFSRRNVVAQGGVV